MLESWETSIYGFFFPSHAVGEHLEDPNVISRLSVVNSHRNCICIYLIGILKSTQKLYRLF